MKSQFVVIAGLASAFLFFLNHPVVSQEDNALPKGIGLIPAKPGLDSQSGAWFVFELKPGETRRDQVAVVNLFDEPTRVKLYPVDATTTKDGAFALEEEGEPKDDLGAWVELDQSEITLPAQSRKEIGFTLTVPDRAEPGDHLGGIIAQKVETATATASIKRVTRTGTRIYLTVPGNVTRLLKFVSASVSHRDNQPMINLTLRNEGNTRIEGFEIKMIFRNRWWYGPPREEITPSNAVIFPRKEVKVEVPWQGGLDLVGDYEAKIVVSYHGGEPIVQTLHFRSFKRKQGLLGLGLAGLILSFTLLVLVTVTRVAWSWLGRVLRRPTRRLPSPAPPTNKERPGLGRVIGDEKKIAVTTGSALTDELKYEIRRIIREELELARLAGRIQNRSYQPGEGRTSPRQQGTMRVRQRLFNRGKKNR